MYFAVSPSLFFFSPAQETSNFVPYSQAAENVFQTSLDIVSNLLLEIATC